MPRARQSTGTRRVGRLSNKKVLNCGGNSCLRRLRIAFFKLVLIPKPDFIAEPPRALSALGFTGYLFIMARSF